MNASVLVVCYNQERYISAAIDSILMQRHEGEKEIVLLDDASTDQTFEIACQKLQNVPNVLLVKNERNLGITKNYQKGFSLCNGEYVFVLEGDDYWTHSSKIKLQMTFLNEHPHCAMCFHPYDTQDDRTGGLLRRFKNINATDFDTFTSHDLIQNEGLIGNYSACCYRKSVLNKLPESIFDLTTYDWLVNIAVGQFGFLGRLNTVMSVYRLSNSGTWSPKPLKEKLRLTEEAIHSYDQVLNYRYSDSFKEKIASLRQQLLPDSSRSRARDFVPPFFIHAAKMITPPAFVRLMRKSNPNV